jgi:hypothetical protein
MAGVDCGSDHELQTVVLIVESASNVDPDDVDRSVRQLHRELRDLEVESIEPLVRENAPLGSKGLDPSSLGPLLVTLSATGGVFTLLIETVRDWLGRQAAARRVSVTINGDTITLEKGSDEERNALINAYLRSHGID